MNAMSWRFRIYLRVVTVAAVAWTCWIFVDRHLARRLGPDLQEQQNQAIRDAEFARIYGGTAVRILQFYSREGSLVEGDKTVLCYGVLNARSVRIEPPVEGVSVALNKCVEVAPEQDTRYTLTAEGNDGRQVSETFVLTVKPDLAALPKITSFRITGHKMNAGSHVFSLTFSVQNAAEVDIDPPVFPTLHGAPYGNFYVAPEKTTTYTLTVTGKKGRKARQQLTVEVPDR